MKDIEDIVTLRKKISGHQHIKFRQDYANYLQEYPNLDEFCHHLISKLKNTNVREKKEFNKIFMELHKTFKMPQKIKNSVMLYHLKTLFSKDIISYQILIYMKQFLRSKNCRSLSGILEVAIMTGPGEFSCKYNCYYCPDQKGFARSYIKEEPAVRRAAQSNFDPVGQIYDRLSAYESNGHDIDKLEIIVLGGTWSNYPHEYQRGFIRDTYYAANTYFDIHKRERLSLAEEKTINENTLCKIIGLSLETRPDCIDKEEILRFLSYGVTRVQIGLQHTNNKLLKKINRMCTVEDGQRAIHMLKDSGFKIMGHLMPNLPGATPEIDKEMFTEMIDNTLNQVDEWKIYPTSITTTSDKDDTEVYTEIERWYLRGKYIPYSESELIDVVIHAKRHINPWIRIARIFRDIPVANITAGAETPHMRQVCQKIMAENDEYCACIRCREIKSLDYNDDDVCYKVIPYQGSYNQDYFICAYVKQSNGHPDGNILGFIRLRLKNKHTDSIEYVDEISGCALVRELHVYGRMRPTYMSLIESTSQRESDNSQHRGVGRKLLSIAEDISRKNSFNKVAIISGVGVRNYYRKFGYKLEGAFMVKKIDRYNQMKRLMYKMKIDLQMTLVGIIFVIISLAYFW